MKFTKKSNFRTRIGGVLSTILAVYAAVLCTLGCIDYHCPDTLSVYGTEILGNTAETVFCETDNTYCATRQVSLSIGGVIPLKTVTVNAYEESVLIPGGMLFGVRCAMEGVLVVGLEDVTDKICPAKTAGVHVGDVITAVDGVTISTVKALSDAVSADGSSGRDTTLTITRNGEQKTLTLTPCKAADGVFRAGIWSRDCTAGIGTVTFIDPETGLFGGLGHGICDMETGCLLPLARGTTLGVTVGEIIPGSAGAPGELRGCFTANRTGTLLDNTTCGVFGIFSSVADTVSAGAYTEPLPVGHADELYEGAATLLCTLDDSGPKEYDIKIVSIGDRNSASNKNFIIEVTDPELLSKTGGIIQGMSGSPILQDGKLVGAVTHVMVNQPGRGYGIFIQNMLAAAG